MTIFFNSGYSHKMDWAFMHLPDKLQCKEKKMKLKGNKFN